MLKQIFLKSGEKPKIAYYSCFDEQLDHLDDELIFLTNAKRLGSTLVLHPLNSGVTRIKSFLDASQHDTKRLEPDNKLDYGDNSIKISTMSTVKGLVFDNVFILDLNDDIMPGPKGSTMLEIEHQITFMRQFFCDSINCATNNLFLFSGSKNNPSRFLQELDPDFIDDITPDESSISDDEFPF